MTKKKKVVEVVEEPVAVAVDEEPEVPVTSTKLTAKGKKRLALFRDLGERWWDQEDGGDTTEIERRGLCRNGGKMDTEARDWKEFDFYARKAACVSAAGWLLHNPTNDREELALWEELNRISLAVLNENLPTCSQYRHAINEGRRLMGEDVPNKLFIVLQGNFVAPSDFDPDEVDWRDYEVHIVKKQRKKSQKPIVCDDPECNEWEYDD